MSPNIQSATCKVDNDATYYWNYTMSKDCPGCDPPTINTDFTGDTALACEFLWYPWQEWSSCDMRCDACSYAYGCGTRNRTRYCPGNYTTPDGNFYSCDGLPADQSSNEETEEEICSEDQHGNLMDCCVHKFDSNDDEFPWYCYDDKCISSDSVCDGQSDCAEGEDELMENCITGSFRLR